MVQEELNNNAYVADTDTFLSRILPVDSAHVDSVLQYLDTHSPSWNSISSDVTKEKDFYLSFVNAANAVVDACRALGIKLEVDHAYWLARPDDAPKSRDELSSVTRPDVAMMLGNDNAQSLRDLDRTTKVLMDKIVACKSEEEKDELTKKLAPKCSIWWLRVLAPVEMKPKVDLENRKSGVNQLCRYLRQVLQEQVDRRFALGLLVCKSKLSVWFYDRSGLLGTATPIDIYTDARKFVQVIMAFSCLPPSKLGWDRSMMIYRPKMRTRHFSTDRDISLGDYNSTVYQTKWAILVPENDDSTTGKWYVTVRTLSTSRAAAMSDRATLVWVVVEMGQSEVSSEHYVLKQAWRMKRSTKEANFRAALTSPTPHVCDIIRSVDMGVKDGETDVKDGTSFLRQGLQLQPFTDSIFANATEVGNEKASELDETKSAEQSVPVIATDGRHAFTAQPCTMRVLTRTLMRTHGWPIKFFKDLLELITVIRDAIEGHRDLYFHGVVHRDISTGNILICYQHNCSDPAHNTFGCLIDLDYAKQTEKRIQYSYLNVPENRIRLFMELLEESFNVQIDYSLAVLILRRFEMVNAITYVRKVLKIFPDTPKSLITKDDLHLYEPNTETPPPFWADRQAGVGRQIGTRAFMSYEVLSGQMYDGIETRRTDCIGTQAFHNAIHDLESFFWVLVYLCLTRKGPGGARRDELCMRDPTDPRTQALHVIVYCLFDSDDDITLTTNKRKLFQQPDDFDTLIMDHFHPYFERLKPLLSRWWKILRLRFYAYDDFVQGTIHQEVLAMLDDEITRISQGSPIEAEKLARDAVEKELARRREELQQNASIARDIHPWEA